MTENQATINKTDPQVRKVPIHERAIPCGRFIVVNGQGVSLDLLKQRFCEGGYQFHQTKHFLLFTRAQAPETIIVHWFSPDEMNADVKHYLVQELKLFGILTQPRDFGEILGGIVGSLFPGDVQRSWRYFG